VGPAQTAGEIKFGVKISAAGTHRKDKGSVAGGTTKRRLCLFCPEIDADKEIIGEDGPGEINIFWAEPN